MNLSNGLIHIVDDDRSIRESLEFMLRAEDYRVNTWADGEDFLKRADRTTPACVLLDVCMPGINGLEVQNRMTEHRFTFPIIMLTGNASIALAVQAMLAGAADFMQKPFNRTILLEAIGLAFQQIAYNAVLSKERELASFQITTLTAREIQVLDGLACGFPNKTIAYDLGLSSRTVEFYRASIMKKLPVNDLAGALRIAFKGGLGDNKAWRAAIPIARSAASRQSCRSAHLQ